MLIKTVKFIGCLIAALIIYFVVGIIAWNIIYSFIDVENISIVLLADYKIATYSGVSIIVTWFALNAINVKNYEVYINNTVILGVVGIIACVVNHWENVWDSTALILTVLYVIVNIYIMGACLYGAVFGFDEEN